jgi:hypothetical protein
MVWKINCIDDFSLGDLIPSNGNQETIQHNAVSGFAQATQIAVQPLIRDSLHLKNAYDCGGSTLSIIQRLFEESDHPAVKEWVKHVKEWISTDDWPESNSWLQSFLTALKHVSTTDNQDFANKNSGDGSPMANPFSGPGSFQNPIIIEGPMGNRKSFNFPRPDQSPRLTQICDYITMNSSKWALSPLMKRIRDGKKPDPSLDPYLWSKFSMNESPEYTRGLREKGVFLFEIFRIVSCDELDLFVIPTLYDMGIGMKDREWEKGPMFERGGVIRYPTLIQNDKSFEKAHRTRYALHSTLSGFGGREIIRIPRSFVQKQYVGRPIVDKNNNPKFGDYIAMMRENTVKAMVSKEDFDTEYRTVPGIGSIHDLVLDRTKPGTGYREGMSETEFLHITMSQAAMGNKKRSNPDSVRDNFRPADWGRDIDWPYNSDESLIPYLNSKSKKIVRPFERMNDRELMSWMAGINTAAVEGQDIGDSVNSASVIFVPTWKDSRGRKTADLTQGMGDYYSDIIRCGECNGRTLVMLPSGNELEATDCPHCDFTGGLNTSHLVEGNPRQVMAHHRTNR